MRHAPRPWVEVGGEIFGLGPNEVVEATRAARKRLTLELVRLAEEKAAEEESAWRMWAQGLVSEAEEVAALEASLVALAAGLSPGAKEGQA